MSSLVKKFLLLTLTATLLAQGASQMVSYAQGTPPTQQSSCKVNNETFFGLPAWYYYLPGQEETVNDNGGNPHTECVPDLSNITDIWLIVAAIIEMLLRIAGLGAIIMVIYGGIRYTVSMGDPSDTAQARQTIIYALVGLLIAVSAAFIVTFVARTFGA